MKAFYQDVFEKLGKKGYVSDEDFPNTDWYVYVSGFPPREKIFPPVNPL